MCVNTQNLKWERPAVEADCGILSKFFPNLDFKGLLKAMSKDNAKPLTSDLVLVAAMMNTPEDDLGMRYVPFSAVHQKTREIVKLPVMDQIVDWYENSALGTDMWNNASDWCEKSTGSRVHFAMNCGCGLVATSSYKNGIWTAWKERFNASRADLFGRTRVVRSESDSIEGLDITKSQVEMWQRMKMALEALPAENVSENRFAA